MLSRLLALVALLPLSAASSFAGSLYSNYVINLDFEGAAAAAGGAEGDEAAAAAPRGEQHVIPFAGGKRKFACFLPSGENQSAQSKEPDAVKARQHFIGAKLAALRGSCWKFSKDYWSYEVCPGSKITQFRPGTEMRFSLGDHLPSSDKLLPDGGVTELFVGGTDNRTSEIRYVCGSSEIGQRIFKIQEEQPLMYIVTISGPTFCQWKEDGASRTVAPDGKEMRVAALLEELRSACINITQGWWTYEYCFPKGITQFHVSGSKRDPEYSLGSLAGTSAPTEVDQVNMSIVRLKPSINPRERRVAPSGHRTLRQRLTGGNVCDETLRPRAADMLFQCPPNWQSKPETNIVSINEASLCEYEVMVHTTLLCGHHRFLPSLPKGMETIQCVAQADEA